MSSSSVFSVLFFTNVRFFAASSVKCGRQRASAVAKGLSLNGANLINKSKNIAITATFDGTEYTGTFNADKTEIIWNDGDIWTLVCFVTMPEC